ILAAGLGPPDQAATAAADTAAVLALVATALGAAPTLDAVVAAIVPGLSAPARRALAGARIDDGEQLYAAADAVEIAWARTRA
ncbi:MAG: hypothetical protein KC464_33555, partial [Myxococcales bacterium]|nr:hypothetical protein [Myxococcales bacterium]